MLPLELIRKDPERVRRTVSEVSALLDERERRFQELGIDSPAEMRERRARRQTEERLADVVLVVDNWPAVKQEFEELEPQLQEIAARGLGYGIHLVLSANRWIDVRSSLREAIGGRLELRLHDPSESAIDRTAAATGEEPEPLVEERGDLGRAHRCDARGSELDREGDAVEAAANFGHR